MLAGVPTGPTEVPAAVGTLAAGRPIIPVWENQLGGLTFAVDQALFVKWNPHGNGIDLGSEIDRLGWAARYVTVPVVVDLGSDDDGTWFASNALDATNAVTERWRQEPAAAVRAIGCGLRILHDRLPVTDCPFSWAAADRVAIINDRVKAGLIDPAGWHDDPRHPDLGQALDIVADPPPLDQLVVCHGDACAPNTLLSEAGAVVGHVDLGSLGVADRWADLAIATWSTVWNYGPGWEDVLLEAYGIDSDPRRTEYYRLLWGLGP